MRGFFGAGQVVLVVNFVQVLLHVAAAAVGVIIIVVVVVVVVVI